MKKIPGHIHVHSEYSLLDGLGSIEEYIKLSKKLGYQFMAITEHGNLFSIYEAGLLEDKYDFHIIKGCEFYTQEFADYKIGHLILLAKNQDGLRDLFELNAAAQENFYKKPRVSPAKLREIGGRGNLICTTACIANLIHQAIKAGNTDDAMFEYRFLKEVFGDDLYLELQTSTVKDEIEAYRKAIKLFPSAQFVLTGDVHYPYPADMEVHDVLMSINTKVKMNSPKKKHMEDTYHLMSSDELYKRFMNNFNDKDLWEECCFNLGQIAKKCRDKVQMQTEKSLPTYDGMTNEEATKELKRLVNEGVRHKLIPYKEYNKEFKEDLIHEVDVISSEGYSGYFLIVNEYCNWARNAGIKVGDGRGSGAGSKVAYTIGITDVNPQKYDLLFERFLAPGRTPDFDVDFSDIGAVFKHLQDKYGKTNVARVGAFTRFSQTTAIQKVMTAYGYSYTVTRRCMESEEEWIEFAAKNPKIAMAVGRLIDKIEHMSTHAGGVVIVNDLVKRLPVFIRSEDKEKLIVGLDKIVLEDLGHYKFDVLGLSGLEVLDKIESKRKVDWKSVDFNDPEIYSMLQAGRVDGVFQLAGQKDKVVQQQPKTFEDIIAINALIRPGVCDWNDYLDARKNNKKVDLKFMEPTHGLIVYQEQYELLAQHYCGWGIGYADKHLRKNKDILNDFELKEKFIKDGMDRGHDMKFMDDLWNEISEIVSQGYSFNKSHATAYAVISFKTAYYKRYYPEDFYAAICSKNIGVPEKLTHFINIAQSEGIEFVPPNINKITEDFEKCEPGKIQLPLTAIKGIGKAAVEELKRLHPIKDLDDLLERRNKSKIKKNNLEKMIKAEIFGKNFSKNFEKIGLKMDVFSCINIESRYESECYGFYINHSPFKEMNLEKIEEGEIITIVQISKITKKKDKNGREYAFINMFNDKDSFESLCLSQTWEKCKGIKTGELVRVEGKYKNARVIVDNIERNFR